MRRSDYLRWVAPLLAAILLVAAPAWAADNYLKNSLPEKARPYLQKIIDKYGDTHWAVEAKNRLAEMK